MKITTTKCKKCKARREFLVIAVRWTALLIAVTALFMFGYCSGMNDCMGDVHKSKTTKYRQGRHFENPPGQRLEFDANKLHWIIVPTPTPRPTPKGIRL